MNNGGISVGNLLDEQHAHAKNQQVKNSTQNQSNSEKIFNITNNKMKTTMPRTFLYIFFFFFLNHHTINTIFTREYSWCSTHQTATAVGAAALFTCIIMIIGILTVCFTSPKDRSMFFFFLIYKSFFYK